MSSSSCPCSTSTTPTYVDKDMDSTPFVQAAALTMAAGVCWAILMRSEGGSDSKRMRMKIQRGLLNAGLVMCVLAAVVALLEWALKFNQADNGCYTQVICFMINLTVFFACTTETFRFEIALAIGQQLSACVACFASAASYSDPTYTATATFATYVNTFCGNILASFAAQKTFSSSDRPAVLDNMMSKEENRNYRLHRIGENNETNKVILGQLHNYGLNQKEIDDGNEIFRALEDWLERVRVNQANVDADLV